MTDTERLTILYGDPNLAPPEQVSLKAGPLSLIYEGGDLRYIRYGKSEIVRRIYVAVRDGKWATIPMTITETERTIGPNSFRIVYTARHTDTERGIGFEWTGTLTGTAEGVVTFDMDGVSLSEFQSNRTGICVLHPADLAGAPCIVRHNDDSNEEGNFPERILPDQPFFDIATITHEAAPDVVAAVGFSGEVFEMEDQRNYLDASYKTYSRPQEWPKPYTIAEGDRIHQTITITLTGKIIPQVETRGPVVVQAVRISDAAFPDVGLTVPADLTPSPEAKELLETLEPDFLRVDADISTDEGRVHFFRADAQAAEIVCDLVVGLVNPEQLPDTIVRTDQVSDYLLLPPSEAAIARALHAGLGDENDIALLGGGSRVYFTELNRLRPTHPKLDVLTYAGNPQVHSVDATSIMETPPTIAETIRTARTFSAEGYEDWRSLQIGPLTLQRATRPPDERQKGLMAAAWYMGIVSHVVNEAQPNRFDLAGICLCDTIGPRGVMDAQGNAYPIYHALNAMISEADPTYVIHAISSEPLRVAACGGFDAEDCDIFLVNLTPNPQEVSVRGLNWTAYHCDVLDEKNPEQLVRTQESTAPPKQEAEQGIGGLVGGLFRRILGGGNEESLPAIKEIALTLGAYAFVHIHGKVAQDE